MASLHSAPAVLKVGRRVRAGDMKLRPGRNIIRGTSGRAYDFEAHPISTLTGLDEVAAIYIYARDVSSQGAHAARQDATAENFALGYIGETADMAATHHKLTTAGDLNGFGYDIALLVCVENPEIRASIVEDILSLHRPVLNDLLRSQHGGLRG